MSDVQDIPSAPTPNNYSPDYDGSEKRHPRILIVDDEESILRSLYQSLMMADENLTIGTASSAEEALALLEKHPVDLILTDLKLPEMDGLQLSKTMQLKNPDTKTILMTAYGNSEISKEATEHGCIGYLEKPFNIESLVGYINDALYHQGEFRADLADLTLTEILQLYGIRQKSTVLSVVSQGAAGMIVIDRGTISHVQFNDKEGPEALVSILECGCGTISSLSCSPPPRSTMRVSWELLEHAIKLHARDEQLKVFSGEAITSEADQSGAEENNSEQPREKTVSEIRERFAQLAGISGRPEFGGLPLRTKTDDSTKNNGAAVDQDRRAPEAIDDFKEAELVLAPEPPPEENVHVPTPKERRDAKLKEFINQGVEHFKAHRLQEARESWVKALRIDDNCVQARRNLTILDQVLEVAAKEE